MSIGNLNIPPSSEDTPDVKATVVIVKDRSNMSSKLNASDDNENNQTKQYLLKNENEKKLCKLTMRTGVRITSEIWNKPYFKVISATDEGLNLVNSKCKFVITTDKM